MTVPSVSRDVHYVSAGSADGRYPSVCRAAKITEIIPELVEEGLVNLIVFNPQGIHFPTNVPYDASGTRPYTWHWPERV